MFEEFKAKITTINTTSDVRHLIDDISGAWCDGKLSDAENDLLIDMIREEVFE